MEIMEAKICLDTDFLVDLLQNKKYAVDFIVENEEKYVMSASIITMFELYCGAYKNMNEKQLLLIEELFARLDILNLSKDIVNEAGKIYAFLRKSGKEIEMKDILIGATAKINKCILKTKNIKHFERIGGLKII